MKTVTLIMLVSTLSAISTASAGTLKGSCTITTKSAARTLEFVVKDNQKAVTKFNNDLNVAVVNNLGNPDALYFSALEIRVEQRDSNSFENPPRLCPTKPEAKKIECEAYNAAHASQTVDAPWEKFLIVKNAGSFGELAKVEALVHELGYGLTLQLPKATFNGTTAECLATFSVK